MNRRASLPGASELFRSTDARHTQPEQPARAEPPSRTDEAVPQVSGRVRHDHKITVYFSAEELMALEDANLDLRRHHGIRVDRGRLVRTAVALALRDLHEPGDESAIIAELS